MHANYLSRVVLENVERVAGAANKKAVTDTFFVIMSGLLCAVLGICELPAYQAMYWPDAVF